MAESDEWKPATVVDFMLKGDIISARSVVEMIEAVNPAQYRIEAIKPSALPATGSISIGGDPKTGK